MQATPRAMPAAAPGLALDVRGLARRFGDLHVLKGLDLQVERRGLHGFLGVNGSGKTTALRIINGFLRPDAGVVRVLDRALAPPLGWRRRVAYLPQDPAFYPWMHGVEYLEWAAAALGLERGERAARVAAVVERVGLQGTARRRIAGWSGGEKQRLGLAQAMLGEPELLLLDEPVSALDPAGRKTILELVQGLGRSAAVLFSSHILEDVERICDRVTILHDGRARVSASIAELRREHLQPVLELCVLGDAAPLLALLDAAPWVKAASLDASRNDTPRLRLTVTDVARARLEVPRHVAELGLPLVSFGERAVALEDIFLKLTGGA